MSLEHVLLGLLERPASGYDLGREFEETAAHFWSAHLSQIYPTLGRMEEKGWLTSHAEPSDRGPDRKVYSRTSDGRRELERWLRGEPEGHASRVAYLGQLFFLGQLDDLAETRRMLVELRERFRERLAALEEIERGWAAEDDRFPDALPSGPFHHLLTLRAGLWVHRARVAWCDEALELLDRRADRGPRGRDPDAATDPDDAPDPDFAPETNPTPGERS